jgi:ribose transport system substrate-binding protein
MHPTKTEGRMRPSLLLLAVAGLILSGLLFAACGSSSSSSSSGSTTEEATTEEGSGGEAETTTDEGEASGGGQETTVYAKGVPTLEELYKSTNEEPPTTGPAAAKGKNVAWFTCSMEAVGCKVPTETFLEAAKVLGWNVHVFDGRLNVNNGYATALRQAIASNPDAIVEMGVGCSETTTPLEEAKAAGIPVVETQNIDCNDPEVGGKKLLTVENQFNKHALSAAELYERFGENQAAYVVDKTEGKAKVILTPWVGTAGQRIATGWKAVFDKCTECEIVEEVEWEASEQSPGGPLEQRFRTALTKSPEANAVIMPFDSMAAFGGLAKSIVDAGRQEEMVVVAGEGFAETLELIREGKGLTAEGGAYDNGWFGWEIADELNRYFNGQPSVPEGLGLAVIDKGNNMPPKGNNYESGVEYAKAYEEIWAGSKEGN